MRIFLVITLLNLLLNFIFHSLKFSQIIIIRNRPILFIFRITFLQTFHFFQVFKFKHIFIQLCLFGLSLSAVSIVRVCTLLVFLVLLMVVFVFLP